jgi:hypothetical protein
LFESTGVCTRFSPRLLGFDEIFKSSEVEAENLALQEEPDSTPAETIWFMFQKTKYVLDEEKHLFRGLTFPVDHSFGYYNSWRGHETDESLAENERHYGTNQYVSSNPLQSI